MSVDIKQMDVITDANSVSVHRKFRLTWVRSPERWSGTGRRHLATSINCLNIADFMVGLIITAQALNGKLRHDLIDRRRWLHWVPCRCRAT